MSSKFVKRMRKARTFDEWIERLRRFNYDLIKENNLQMWTLQDFKNYWTRNGRII